MPTLHVEEIHLILLAMAEILRLLGEVALADEVTDAVAQRAQYT